MPKPRASRPALARTLRYTGQWDRAKAVEVPVEVPVNIRYGTLPYVVLMASPSELENLVLGFSLTEGIITGQDEIRSVAILEEARGLIAEVDLAPAAMTRFLARRRNMAGRTSCGLCGIEDFDQMPQALRRITARRVEASAIARALGALDALQPLHRETRAVHAAAWFSLAGEPLAAREDVGRHNALDKLIGACLEAGHPPEQGFAVITSRCSFEMVEKAAIFGAGTLVAISAPTSLAIERANALGLTLIAIARADKALAFTDHPETIQEAITS